MTSLIASWTIRWCRSASYRSRDSPGSQKLTIGWESISLISSSFPPFQGVEYLKAGLDVEYCKATERQGGLYPLPQSSPTASAARRPDTIAPWRDGVSR